MNAAKTERSSLLMLFERAGDPVVHHLALCFLFQVYVGV